MLVYLISFQEEYNLIFHHVAFTRSIIFEIPFTNFLNVLETSVELVFGDCDAVRSSLLGVLLRVALLALRLAVLLVLTDKLSSVLDNDGEDFFSYA